MKTKVNQIMVMAFLALVLLSANVNANDKEAIVVSGLENMVEVQLEIESWMVTETFWVMAETNTVLEENLEIEAWMLNEENWKVQAVQCPEEKENLLVVKQWMINDIYWN